jgi:polar amino acid transport system ATP-binding protein
MGKSTFLSCLAQLYTDYTGTVSLATTNLKSLSPRECSQQIGLVFQKLFLFPQLTALQNVAQPLWINGLLSKQDAYSSARTLLETFGMLDFADRYSSHLSGGQQQRVALARALGLQPRVLCLDEPTSSLDEGNTLLLVEELKRLKDQGIILIIASHDRTFVEACADRIVELKDGSLKPLRE